MPCRCPDLAHRLHTRRRRRSRSPRPLPVRIDTGLSCYGLQCLNCSEMDALAPTYLQVSLQAKLRSSRSRGPTLYVACCMTELIIEAPSRSARTGAGAKALWASLRRHVEALDSPAHGFRLRLAAVEALLAADAHLEPPPWLLDPYQARNDGAEQTTHAVCVGQTPPHLRRL